MIEIPGLNAPRAKRYHRIRLAAMLAETAAGVAGLAWFTLSGRSRRLRTWMRAHARRSSTATAGYAAVTLGSSWLAALPWSYGAGYLVERHFELTRQSSRAWLVDRLKSLAVSLALETPLVVGSYAVIRRRPRDWWMLLSGMAVPLTVLLGRLAPVIILPLFNRFDPLGDDELEQRIRALGERAGVPISQVFRMDMSRQTEKANAFFTGLGASKRIALGDTMLDRYAAEEIEAVVAHELGHQVHGDMWRLIAMGSAAMFAVAYGVGRTAPLLIRQTTARTGVQEIGDEAGMPLIGLVAGGLGAVAAPISAAVSRAMERRCDRFALQLTGNGPAYASTMARMAAQNLADPDPPRWVVLLLYSHPPVAERIALARVFPDAEKGARSVAEATPSSV